MFLLLTLLAGALQCFAETVCVVFSWQWQHREPQAVIQLSCRHSAFLQHIHSGERLPERCQLVCCIHMCAGVDIEKTNRLGTNHLAAFRCLWLQLSAALLSFLWELLCLVFSLLFVWKAYDDIKYLIYYHYSSTNLQLQTQWILVCTKSMAAINPSLSSQIYWTCDSPASSALSHCCEKSPMCQWDVSVCKAWKTAPSTCYQKENCVQMLFHTWYT